MEQREALWTYREDFNQLNFEQSLPPRWVLMSLHPTGFYPAWGPSPGKGSPGFGYYGTLPAGEGQTRALALFEGAPLRPPFSLSVHIRASSKATFGLALSFQGPTDFELIERSPTRLHVWGRHLDQSQTLLRADLPRLTNTWHFLQIDRSEDTLRIRLDNAEPFLIQAPSPPAGLIALLARGGAVSFENLTLTQWKP